MGFNPLTIGAVRSAKRKLATACVRTATFQSPHYRGSPFGKFYARCEKVVVDMRFNPLTIGAVRSAYKVACALGKRHPGVSIPSLSGQSVRLWCIGHLI